MTTGFGAFGGRVQIDCTNCRNATWWWDEAVAVRSWNTRAALPSDAQGAPNVEPTPLDDETVAVIRSFVDRPGETYRGVVTRRLGIGFGRALRRAIEESRVDRASDGAGTPLTDVQRAAIQAAVDTASRVLRAGGDGGDELSDAGLRRELKESRDMLRDMLDAAHPPTVAADAAAPSETRAASIDQRFDALRATGHGLYGALRNIVNSDKAALSEILAICGVPSASAPQAALTTEQREAIEWATGRAHVMSLGKPVDGIEFRRWRVLSNLFSNAPAAAATPPTERMSDAARECAWTYDDVDYKWDSACGESWVFNDDGPAENNARFCQGCGGKIKIAARKAETERSGSAGGEA